MWLFLQLNRKSPRNQQRTDCATNVTVDPAGSRRLPVIKMAQGWSSSGVEQNNPIPPRTKCVAIKDFRGKKRS